MELVDLGRRNYSNNHTYTNAKCFPEEDVQMKRQITHERGEKIKTERVEYVRPVAHAKIS